MAPLFEVRRHFCSFGRRARRAIFCLVFFCWGAAGDVNSITIGDNSNIGEDCVVHVSSGVTEVARPTNIGNDVIVGTCVGDEKKMQFAARVALAARFLCVSLSGNNHVVILKNNLP